MKQGRLTLSACVQPEPYTALYGLDYPYLSRGKADRLFPHRLRSTWGPHWECEEVALGVNHTNEQLRQLCLVILSSYKKL